MRDYLLHSCLIFVVVCLTGINSQLGPPPRFSIPGAIPVPVRQPLQYRNERLVTGAPSPGFLRVRHPVLPAAGRANTLQSLQAGNSFAEDAKPVTEENESNETPSFISQQINPSASPLFQQPQLKQQLPAILYSTDENGEILDQHRTIEFPTTQRFVPSIQENIVPTTLRTSGAQRFLINQDRPAPIQPSPQPTKAPQLRARPDYREPRPQFEFKEQNDFVQAQPKQRRPQSEFLQAKPRPNHNNDDDREKKPVAQILRKYREENEDGTITWGFENDDGSFKEEIIGNDCVTRGRYGYVDPDGVKREYNYETGIQCDPNKRDLEEDSEESEDPERQGANLQDNGAYIDYQENQMVLPNGQRINLNNVGKTKARRPNFRNN